MELDDLIMLGACSLLSKKFSATTTDDSHVVTTPNSTEIREAVRIAHKVWRATLDND